MSQCYSMNPRCIGPPPPSIPPHILTPFVFDPVTSRGQPVYCLPPPGHPSNFNNQNMNMQPPLITHVPKNPACFLDDTNNQYGSPPNRPWNPDANEFQPNGQKPIWFYAVPALTSPPQHGNYQYVTAPNVCVTPRGPQKRCSLQQQQQQDSPQLERIFLENKPPSFNLNLMTTKTRPIYYPDQMTNTTTPPIHAGPQGPFVPIQYVPTPRAPWISVNTEPVSHHRMNCPMQQQQQQQSLICSQNMDSHNLNRLVPLFNPPLLLPAETHLEANKKWGNNYKSRPHHHHHHRVINRSNNRTETCPPSVNNNDPTLNINAQEFYPLFLNGEQKTGSNEISGNNAKQVQGTEEEMEEVNEKENYTKKSLPSNAQSQKYDTINGHQVGEYLGEKSWKIEEQLSIQRAQILEETWDSMAKQDWST